MDWSRCPDAESRPSYVSGAWCVKGTRVQADAIVENFDEGYSAEEIVDEIFPTLPLDRVKRIIVFAREHARDPA